jgi:2-phospho-L-lactate guanylyltransferase (CobY/MobA/RfbA family)
MRWHWIDYRGTHMFDVLKEAIELVRQKRQLNRDTRRLEVAYLDYAALQRIVEEVANKNVIITITNGTNTMVIKPKEMNQIDYKSFDERVAEARKMR